MWSNMKQRCNNKNRLDYKYYGGKGVKIYEPWEEYKAFKQWAIKNGYSKKLTIDRIDFNGDYEPNNCRFITIEEQQKNKSNNRMLEYRSEVKTLSEWSKEYGINRVTLDSRLRAGYSLEEALSKKDGELLNSTKYKYKGKSKTLTQWAKEYNMSKNCLNQRLVRGWSLKEALEKPVKSRN